MTNYTKTNDSSNGPKLATKVSAFLNGHKLASKILDAGTAVTSASSATGSKLASKILNAGTAVTSAVNSATGSTSSFVSGFLFAIREARGVPTPKPEVAEPKATKPAGPTAEQVAAWAAEGFEAESLYVRAHGGVAPKAASE
jgi:hypothetical protein